MISLSLSPSPPPCSLALFPLNDSLSLDLFSINLSMCLLLSVDECVVDIIPFTPSIWREGVFACPYSDSLRKRIEFREVNTKQSKSFLSLSSICTNLVIAGAGELERVDGIPRDGIDG